MLDLLRAKMPWPDLLFRDFVPSGFALSNVFFVLGLIEAAFAFICLRRGRQDPLSR